MTYYRTKLHPSSCFPSNPSTPNTQNRLFIRIAPNQSQHCCSRLTFIGVNATSYSTIAALLAYRPLASIECIKLFDVCQKLEARTTLNDLQLVALLNKTNTHLQWAQSYWETRDSTVIIINVQHHQLENESVSTWIQVNASLVEDVVSQVCIYSPHATLIICTQPNELMTHVAWRVSRFPSERILGLGASVETAYAHKTIRDQTENVHGRVNGFFILGNGRPSDSCATVFTNHLTINGIYCSDIMTNQVENKTMENQSISKQRKLKDWDLVKILEDNGTIYSDISRRLPIITDLISRQKTAIKYLLSNYPISHPKPKPQRSIEISLTTKPYSNWTEAMLIVHIIRALINNNEFQSNFAVNTAPMNNSNDVFINYPTILGSSHGVIKYMFPFRQAQNLLQQRSFLIPYEKFQRKIRRLKSKD